MKDDPYWKTMFGFMNRKDKEMKDDSLSDVQNMKRPEYTKLPKRSECKCFCHTDANTLGYINASMHIMPCCKPDDNLKVPLDMSQANCPHGIAMDIYCNECEANSKIKEFEDIGAEMGMPPIQDSVGISEHDKLVIELREWRLKLEKEIWNKAIEAAAFECEQWDNGVSPKSDVAPEIRKLKK